MKLRARRAVIWTAPLVALVVAVLVLTNWTIVRDHLEAWHFQLTRTTVIAVAGERCSNLSLVGRLSWELADLSACPVIFEPEEPIVICGGVGGGAAPQSIRNVLGFLTYRGYRVVEQCIPRKAYIVVRDKR